MYWQLEIVETVPEVLTKERYMFMNLTVRIGFEKVLQVKLFLQTLEMELQVGDGVLI